MQPANPRLPVGKVIAGALILSWERRHALFKALWLPLLLGVAFTVSESLWGPSSWEQGSADQESAQQGSLLLWTLPMFALTVVFAVRSYRVYLIGGAIPVTFAPISWGMRETRFIFAMAGVAFAFLMSAFVFGGIVAMLWPDVSNFAGGRFGLALIIPSGYLVGRLLLAFPALAADHCDDVFQALLASWKMTRRNGWKVLLLCVVLPGALAWSLDQIARLPLPGVDLVSAIAVWMIMPVELALVALAYVSLKPAKPFSEIHLTGND
ncbi:MAG: hypothetical protein PVH25_04010 [Burkholderiales bacterium]|jgi:hypothetical protein